MTRSTTLQLHNPPNLAESGSYTRLQLTFRTKHKHGLLVYMGPDGGANRHKQVRHAPF